jgi:predicted membrane protein
VALENRVPAAHNLAMEQIISKIIGFLVVVCMAAVAALTVGYIAHYDYGLSRLDIRTSALIGATILALIVALLSATEHFEKNLRKPK